VTTNDFYRGKRVAVTGADGFIGSHLTESLARLGADVRALSYYTSFGSVGWLDRLPPELRQNVSISAGDVRDPRLTDRFVDGAEVVFHLAALIGIPYSYAAPHSYVDVNVSGTLNILEAVRRSGSARLVHTSTSEVYGTAQIEPIPESHPLQGQSPYSASKIGADHMVEAYARSFDLPAVTLRPFNTYGPRQSERAVIPTVIRQALDPNCTEIALGDLSTARDFNYVGDTVAAFLALGAAPKVEYGTAYNSGTGDCVTIGEMTKIVRRLTGSEKPIVQKTERFRPANSEVFKLIASADRLNAAAGWRPALSLEEGLERTVAWWREELEAGRVSRGTGYAV